MQVGCAGAVADHGPRAGRLAEIAADAKGLGAHDEVEGILLPVAQQQPVVDADPVAGRPVRRCRRRRPRC